MRRSLSVPGDGVVGDDPHRAAGRRLDPDDRSGRAQGGASDVGLVDPSDHGGERVEGRCRARHDADRTTR
jgi:hypothetical protein